MGDPIRGDDVSPLKAYHLYAAKYAFAPTLSPPADLCAATLPYVCANAKQTQTAKTRDLLRLHRAAQAGAPDLFAAHKTPEALAAATGLPLADAEAQLSAYAAARGLKVQTRPRPPIPAYQEPPPLDPNDPIADYHRRVGADDSVRFKHLIAALGLKEHAARCAYREWLDGEPPKVSPPGQPRPWLAYARARISEGYTPQEIAAAIQQPLHAVRGVRP